MQRWFSNRGHNGIRAFAWLFLYYCFADGHGRDVSADMYPSLFDTSSKYVFMFIFPINHLIEIIQYLTT